MRTYHPSFVHTILTLGRGSVRSERQERRARGLCTIEQLKALAEQGIALQKQGVVLQLAEGTVWHSCTYTRSIVPSVMLSAEQRTE